MKNEQEYKSDCIYKTGELLRKLGWNGHLQVEENDEDDDCIVVTSEGSIVYNDRLKALGALMILMADAEKIFLSMYAGKKSRQTLLRLNYHLNTTWQDAFAILESVENRIDNY